MEAAIPTEERAELLREVDCFDRLPKSVVAELATLSEIARYEEGEMILQEGDRPDAVYLVQSGEVKIYKISPQGRELTIAREGRAGFVALLPLLDGGEYPGFAEATEPTSLLKVPRKQFQQIRDRHPELYPCLVEHLSNRVRELVRLVEDLSFKDVYQRLAAYLYRVSERRGDQFELTVTNSEIASSLGSVREIVSRNFSRLKEMDAIAMDRKQVQILDREKLEKIAEGEL